ITCWKCCISSMAIAVSSCTKSWCSEFCVISEMAFEAAFCSHQAWSVRISSKLDSAMFAQRGSVNNFNPSILMSSTCSYKIRNIYAGYLTNWLLLLLQVARSRLPLVQAVLQPHQSVGQHRPRTAEVQSQKPFSSAPIQRPRTHPKPLFPQEPIRSGGGRRHHCTAVEPRQVCGFRRQECNLGEVVGAKVRDISYVACQITPQLLQPIRTVAVCRDGRLNSKGAQQRRLLPGLYLSDLRPDSRMLAEQVRYLHSRQVERLARGAGGDGLSADIGRHRVEWDMPVSGIYEVGVDFVGNDRHAVGRAQLTDAQQLFAGPHPSHRIVRVAEQKQSCRRISQFRLQICKVDPITAIAILEVIGRHTATAMGDRIKKMVVYRRLDDDFVAFPGKRPYGCSH